MINSFQDLDVYKRAFSNAIAVDKEIIPILKSNRQFNLADQLDRCTKAIPALIAEGHAKRNQQKNFQKYLDDAMGESNEATAHLAIAQQLISSITLRCQNFIDEYIIVSKQLYRLGESWNKLRGNPPRTNHQPNHQ